MSPQKMEYKKRNTTQGKNTAEQFKMVYFMQGPQVINNNAPTPSKSQNFSTKQNSKLHQNQGNKGSTSYNNNYQKSQVTNNKKMSSKAVNHAIQGQQPLSQTSHKRGTSMGNASNPPPPGMGSFTVINRNDGPGLKKIKSKTNIGTNNAQSRQVTKKNSSTIQLNVQNQHILTDQIMEMRADYNMIH